MKKRKRRKKAFEKDPDIWDYIDENGRSIYNIIEEDKSILETASPTPYLKVALKLPVLGVLLYCISVELITHSS